MPPVEHLMRTELRHADGRRLLLYGPHQDGALPRQNGLTAPPQLHLRFDELTDRWVAISPARNSRPQTRTAEAASPPGDCPLCPGGPEVPFDYTGAVFDNRFPTLMETPPAPPSGDGTTAASHGACEVVLYTSTHTGSLATLTTGELARVIAMWADRTADLWGQGMHRFVMPFENRGDGVGATLSHPHGQIYALDHVPPLVVPRIGALDRHRSVHGTCLTCAVLTRDDAALERRIVTNSSFVVAVPFAPDWPYEVHVRARRHGARRLADLTAVERRDLAAALREVVVRFDRLYDTPIPYLMTVMESPARGDDEPVDDWHLAIEFRPPNRAADKLKVRASVETVAGFFINDTLPEESARQLAAVQPPDGPVDPDVFPDIVIVAMDVTAPAPSPTRG